MIDLTYFQVAEWRLMEWQQAYPAVDVAGELQRMKCWLDANPRRRKKRYDRFATNWLSKENARAETQRAGSRIGRQEGHAILSRSDREYYEKFYAQHPDLKPPDWKS